MIVRKRINGIVGLLILSVGLGGLIVSQFMPLGHAVSWAMAGVVFGLEGFLVVLAGYKR